MWRKWEEKYYDNAEVIYTALAILWAWAKKSVSSVSGGKEIPLCVSVSVSFTYAIQNLFTS
jgi:hypothetical protein